MLHLYCLQLCYPHTNKQQFYGHYTGQHGKNWRPLEQFLCLHAHVIQFPTLFERDGSNSLGMSHVRTSGGQIGEWALVQEEQMGPLLTREKFH